MAFKINTLLQWNCYWGDQQPLCSRIHCSCLCPHWTWPPSSTWNSWWCPSRNTLQPGFQGTLRFRFSFYLAGHSFLKSFTSSSSVLTSWCCRAPGSGPGPLLVYIQSLSRSHLDHVQLTPEFMSLAPTSLPELRPLYIQYFPDLSTEWLIDIYPSGTLD